ncbi:MAG: hypothetical protein KKF67_00270 [Nanoarchaeota archaeon]|nr:hypothetical protein [Nanoarchaeota archaeon]
MEYTEEAYWGKVRDFSDSLCNVANRALKGKKLRKRHLEYLENAEKFFDSCKLAEEATGDRPQEWVDDSNFRKVFLPITLNENIFPQEINYYFRLLTRLEHRERVDTADAELLRQFSFSMVNLI